MVFRRHFTVAIPVNGILQMKSRKYIGLDNRLLTLQGTRQNPDVLYISKSLKTMILSNKRLFFAAFFC